MKKTCCVMLCMYMCVYIYIHTHIVHDIYIYIHTVYILYIYCVYIYIRYINTMYILCICIIEIICIYIYTVYIYIYVYVYMFICVYTYIILYIYINIHNGYPPVRLAQLYCHPFIWSIPQLDWSRLVGCLPIRSIIFVPFWRFETSPIITLSHICNYLGDVPNYNLQ